MKVLSGWLAVAAFASPAFAQPQMQTPPTAQSYYELGQRFANCSARFAHMAEIARDSGLSDTVKLAEGRARGWKFAGMFFLAQGMDPSRINETEPTFDTLVEVKLMDLKSRAELDADAYQKAIPKEFEQECGPLVSIQEKLIETMRRGPAPH